MSQQVKFSSQAAPETLAAIKEIARQEGRQLQSVLDEAMRDLIEKKRTGKARAHVLEAFGESLGEYDSLYDALAK